MFYCFGETQTAANVMGKGETIEAAICDWANEIDLHLAAAEFNTWQPTVIEGDKLIVVFNTTVTKG